MSYEIEARIYMSITKALKRFLEKKGCTFVRRTYEVNQKYYLDDVLESGRPFMRLRKERDEEGTVRFYLVSKGPKEPSIYTKRVKSKREIPLEVAATLEDFPWERTYTKVRVTYMTPDGKIKISLDNRSDVGERVEVEGASEKIIKPWVDLLEKYKRKNTTGE